mmetsp:Transcript_4188/g.13503  ORF Transcript_4188/g.13503 Transcript_4188/m.13503 type:complete len:99 (+) Transcript_4188:941-1237(+)
MGSGGLVVKGNAFGPRTGSFEVTVDTKLVYSKLESGMFPDPNAVVDDVAKQLGVEARPHVAVQPVALTREELHQVGTACFGLVVIVVALVLGVQFLLS